MEYSFRNESDHSAGDNGSGMSAGRRRGVLLVNVGTPDAPEPAAVRRYLAEFLSDPMVIQLPAGLGWFHGILGRLIARFRAARSVEKYREIWTDRGSPLKVIMEDQASALASVLPEGWRVFVGMRNGHPRIADALADIEAAGIEELVIVPMYPQFSRTTSGTVIREVYRALKHVGGHLNVAVRTTWYDDAAYVSAQARLLAEYASRHGLTPADTHLVFSAHGLPVSYIERGDPYARQVDRSVKLVAQRLGWPADRVRLAFQSRLGPAQWLKPDVPDVLNELAAAGHKRVMICPISFSVDCLETLEEIDIRYRAEFEAAGGQMYLCPALNDYGPFIGALKNLVLRGPQPVTSWGTDMTPLVAPQPQTAAADSDLRSLVMMGVSLANRLGPGRGPRLEYSQPQALASVKIPHDEVLSVLRGVREQGLAREALIWNTCHRFEFYGWLDGSSERNCVVARLRRRLFASAPDGLEINVLFGDEAWHHLMRTAAGLNSGLPGDADVVEQLQTAHRVAEGAGTAGQRSKCLVDEAVALAHVLREETEWGRQSPGYCLASLARLRDAAGHDLAALRHLVIGGSTTSCSVLHTLRERFDVGERQLALAYRSHKGGQVKLLRKAVGSGQRLRVQSYTDNTVLKALADADVVYFGIDSQEPVVSAEEVRGLRDFAQRPLTVIDFNTFGSAAGLESIEGVTVWNAARLEQEVGAYAEAMCAQEQFGAAVDQAERWIDARTPEPVPPSFHPPCAVGREVTRPRCHQCQMVIEPEAAGRRGL